jgi:uncharacterized membrane protein
MATRGIGTAVRIALGGLSAGLIGAGLWGLGQPEDALARVVCSEAHCVEAAGLYQVALLVGTLLLAVVLLATGRRERAHARADGAPRIRAAPAAHRRT